MAASTMTSKGQVTIPKSIRNTLGVGPGDRIRFVQQDGVVVVEPETIDVRSLRGLFADRVRRPVSIEEMDRAIAEAVSKSVVGNDGKT